MKKNEDKQFEQYLKKVAGKIGPGNAFSLARDARINALQKLMEKKFGQHVVKQAINDELKKTAQTVEKMPVQFPDQTK